MDWSKAPDADTHAAQARAARWEHVGLMEAGVEGFLETTGWAEAGACQWACLFERARAVNAPRTPPTDAHGAFIHGKFQEALGAEELPPVGFTRRMLEAVFDRLALALREHAEQAHEEAEQLLASARAWAEGDDPWTGVDSRRDGYDNTLSREGGADVLWRATRDDPRSVTEGWFDLPDAIRVTARDDGMPITARHYLLERAVWSAFRPDVLHWSGQYPYDMMQDLRTSKENAHRYSLAHTGEPLAELMELIISWHEHTADLLHACAEHLRELRAPWADAVWLYMTTGVWIFPEQRGTP